MTGFSDFWAKKVIDHSTGKTAIGAAPSVYMGLFTTAPTDGGGGVEVAGGAYARVAVPAANWNAASGSAPSITSNSAAATFPTATANWGTVVAFGIFDAAAGGDLLWWDYLGNYAWQPFTGSLASPSVLTAPAHGYGNGDSVVVSNEYGGSLPPTAGSWAGLLSVAGVTTDTFNVGVNATGTGSGSVRKVASQQIPSGVQASFAGGAPGTLQLTLA